MEKQFFSLYYNIFYIAVAAFTDKLNSLNKNHHCFRNNFF